MQPGLTAGCAWLCREVRSFRRQARMLAGLPGPQTRHILGFTDILTSKEPHRLLLAMAERYGPIFSFRVIHLHVGPPLTRPQQCDGSVSGLANMLHTQAKLPVGPCL